MKKEYVDYLISIQNTLIRNGVDLPISITDDTSSICTSVDVLEDFCYWNRFMYACNSTHKIAILSCTGKVLFSEIQKEELLKELEAEIKINALKPAKEKIELTPNISITTKKVTDFNETMLESLRNRAKEISVEPVTEDEYLIIGVDSKKRDASATRALFDDTDEYFDEDLTDEPDEDIIVVEETTEDIEDNEPDEDIIIVEDSEDLEDNEPDEDIIVVEETSEDVEDNEPDEDIIATDDEVSEEDEPDEDIIIVEEDSEDEEEYGVCSIIPSMYEFFVYPENFVLAVDYTDLDPVFDFEDEEIMASEDSEDTEDSDMESESDEDDNDDMSADEDEDMSADEDMAADEDEDMSADSDEDDATVEELPEEKEDADEDKNEGSAPVVAEDEDADISADEDDGDMASDEDDEDVSADEDDGDMASDEDDGDMASENDFDDSYTPDETLDDDEDLEAPEEVGEEADEDDSSADPDISADDYFSDSLDGAEFGVKNTRAASNTQKIVDISNSRCLDERVADTLTEGVSKVFDLCKKRIHKMSDQNKDKT